MDQEKHRLFDAEHKFMDIVWNNEPINSTELCKICNRKLGWKKSTTYTMIKKLSDRGILENRNATVRSLVKREQVQQYEIEALLERSFGNSIPAFITAFLDSKILSQKEIDEIKRIIEEATK